MTGIEYKQALKSLGWSQRNFCRMMGFSPSTSNTWAMDRVRVPPIVAAYLRQRMAVLALMEGDG